jgi:hypothetical protein
MNKLRTYEFIQKAGNGGFPVPNEGPFTHGESVLVVSTRELVALFKMMTLKLEAGMRHKMSPQRRDRYARAVVAMKEITDEHNMWVVPPDWDEDYP